MLQFFALILAGVSIGVADTLIKKASLADSLSSLIKNPLLLFVLFLYLLQIITFVYIFRHNWNLGIVGNIQMVFYSITITLLSFIVFGENISPLQGTGIVLALIGVVLMNL